MHPEKHTATQKPLYARRKRFTSIAMILSKNGHYISRLKSRCDSVLYLKSKKNALRKKPGDKQSIRMKVIDDWKKLRVIKN
jgi:hypothetical protein